MKRITLLIFMVCTALFAGAFIYAPEISVSIGSFVERTDTQDKDAILTDAKTSVTFVGDVLLARNVEYLMDTYGEMYPFMSLPQTPTTTYLVGNFEAAIPKVHVKTPSMQFAFSVKESYAKLLPKLGFTHLGLANNHAYDFGREGYLNTTEVLNASSSVFGDPRNQASSTIQILNIDNKNIALIGLYAVDVTPTEYEIAALLERARLESDLQIVYVHWGEEYKLLHNASQEKLAYSLIDSGADIIIGHHPHVVQDIEIYKGKPIFYSLGNFIFDQYWNADVQEGLLLVLYPTHQELRFELYPVSSVGSRSQPRLMAQVEKETFLSKLADNNDTELAAMIKGGLLLLPQ